MSFIIRHYVLRHAIINITYFCADAIRLLCHADIDDVITTFESRHYCYDAYVASYFSFSLVRCQDYYILLAVS